jgi:hypothetical protein
MMVKGIFTQADPGLIAVAAKSVQKYNFKSNCIAANL